MTATELAPVVKPEPAAEAAGLFVNSSNALANFLAYKDQVIERRKVVALELAELDKALGIMGDIPSELAPRRRGRPVGSHNTPHKTVVLPPGTRLVPPDGTTSKIVWDYLDKHGPSTKEAIIRYMIKCKVEVPEGKTMLNVLDRVIYTKYFKHEGKLFSNVSK